MVKKSEEEEEEEFLCTFLVHYKRTRESGHKIIKVCLLRSAPTDVTDAVVLERPGRTLCDSTTF